MVERRMKKKFYCFGTKSFIEQHCQIDHPDLISIGERVSIRSYGWIYCLPQKDGGGKPQLLIGDGTYIGRFSHICASREVILGKKVLIADKVYIADTDHSYENVNLPICDSPLKVASIEIGDETWIGENVVILPGVKIGRHCVIGANAVVNKDVPDFSVAVGQPARVIKKYSNSIGNWMKL